MSTPEIDWNDQNLPIPEIDWNDQNLPIPEIDWNDCSFRNNQVQRSMFDLSSINNAIDLLEAVRICSNAGDRIELFFTLAEKKPEVAFSSFITILNNDADVTLRALALRSFGKITNPAIRQEIVACQSEHSQELLHFLVEEVKGRSEYSNDLTQWAALEAILQLGYKNNFLSRIALGGLQEPPRRLSNEIIYKKIEQGNRLHQNDRYISRNQLTPGYQRYLEFWVYGPTERLFSEGSYDYDTVDRVLSLLRVRALTLAFDPSSGREVQMKAYTSGKIIFKHYTDPSLSESLKRFLKTECNNNAALSSLSQAITFENESPVNGDIRKFIMSALRKAEADLRRYKAYICSLFTTATAVCENSILVDFLHSDRAKYSSQIQNQLTQVTSTIDELERTQRKIAANCHLLNQSCNQARNIDSELYIKVESLAPSGQFLSHNNENTITIEKCQQLISDLNSRKYSFSQSCSQRKQNLDNFIIKEEDTFKPLAWGIFIVLGSAWLLDFNTFWWLYTIGFILVGGVICVYIVNVYLRNKKREIEEMQNTINNSWQQ